MHVIVYITASNAKEAADIAEALLKERLAACANVVESIKSIYWWKGQIESASEYRCTIKTLRGRLPEVFAAVASLHPYEVPELLALPVIASGESYRQWLLSEVPGVG